MHTFRENYIFSMCITLVNTVKNSKCQKLLKSLIPRIDTEFGYLINEFSS